LRAGPGTAGHAERARGRKAVEPAAAEGESPVRPGAWPAGDDPEYPAQREGAGEAGRTTVQDYRHPHTDSAEYREGKVKSPPGGECKQT